MVNLQQFSPSNSDLVFQVWWANLEGKIPAVQRKGINLLVVLVAWWLWKQRNECVFEGATHGGNRIIQNIKDGIHRWCLAGARCLRAVWSQSVCWLLIVVVFYRLFLRWIFFRVIGSVNVQRLASSNLAHRIRSCAVSPRMLVKLFDLAWIAPADVDLVCPVQATKHRLKPGQCICRVWLCSCMQPNICCVFLFLANVRWFSLDVWSILDLYFDPLNILNAQFSCPFFKKTIYLILQKQSGMHTINNSFKYGMNLGGVWFVE